MWRIEYRVNSERVGINLDNRQLVERKRITAQDDARALNPISTDLTDSLLLATRNHFFLSIYISRSLSLYIYKYIFNAKSRYYFLFFLKVNYNMICAAILESRLLFDHYNCR